MDYLTGNEILMHTTLDELSARAQDGRPAHIHGAVHNIRDMGDFAFVIIRIPEGLVQCVVDKKDAFEPIFDQLENECSVELTGQVKEDKRAPGGYEITPITIHILSRPNQSLPVNVSKRFRMGVNLDTDLSNRPITLRSGEMRARFRIQAAIVRAFQTFMSDSGFTAIHTPKIVGGNAEGGTNVFRLDYFGQKAFLAQSPQFYKQTMVGVYERVFEVGPVFRAEKHSTVRHLNEYISLDFEMGYIRDLNDLMNMQTACLKHVFQTIQKECQKECKALKIELPTIERIPVIRFREAKERISEKYGHKIRDPFDLEPAEEQLIGRYFKEEYDSDFVFVTHYPSKKRPFYTMDDPQDSQFTLSFDLLFRGMEVTTGGQRIHDYDMQVEKMKDKGLDPESFEDYLMIHKHGIPPHGGLGMGLERLCMKLFEDNNVRFCSLFPRDMNRLTP